MDAVLYAGRKKREQTISLTVKDYEAKMELELFSFSLMEVN